MDKKKFVSGTAMVLFGMLFAKLVSLVIRMLVARLGVVDSGIFYLSLYILKMVVLVSFLGFEAFLVRDIAEAVAKKDLGLVRKIIKCSVAILLPLSVLLGGILFFSAGDIAGWFNEPGLARPVMIIAFSVPFMVGLKIATDSFRGSMRRRAFIFFEHLSKDALRLVFAVVAFVWAGTVTAILFGSLLCFVIVSVAAGIFIVRTLFRRDARKRKASLDWKAVFSFTLPIYGGMLAFASLEWIDSFMIGKMVSVAEVGIYDAAFSVAWCLLLLPSATMTFLLPKIISIHNDRRLMRAYYMKVAAWNIALNGLFASMFILFGKILLRVLFGREFTQGYVFLVVLAIGFWIAHSLIVARAFLYINRKGVTLLVIALAAAVLSIVLNYILIRIMGTLGAAVATAISAVALTAGYVIATYHDIGLLPFSKRLLVPAAGFGVVLIGSVFTSGLDTAFSIACSVILIAAYVVVHALSPYWRNDFKKAMAWFMRWTVSRRRSL